ncbi:MAG: pyruvoyl-dependent arginine decarboxylase, partial [Syntrophales bacterium]|nr:pyruvoyl-dependent arginine decarboxylase [Syntrophales bacterium]
MKEEVSPAGAIKKIIVGPVCCRLKEKKTLSLYVPKKMFFTKGVGIHREELHSFELALRDAG